MNAPPVFWTPGKNTSKTPPYGGVYGISSWEEATWQTEDSVDPFTGPSQILKRPRKKKFGVSFKNCC